MNRIASPVTGPRGKASLAESGRQSSAVLEFGANSLAKFNSKGGSDA